jgi:RNA recognition motif-containing protein
VGTPLLRYTHTITTMSNQPNTTLYLNNLNDQVNKEELRSQLFALFTTYGKIIDIVASKSQSMRGQAFLVFTDLAGATSAMRACEGMVFYDKPLVSLSRLLQRATSKRIAAY